MELRPLDGETSDILLEEPPQASAARTGRPRKKRGGRWPRLVLPVALVAAAVLALALNATALQVRFAPLWALRDAVGRVAALPQPLSLGFLGEVELEDWTKSCSGVLAAQAGPEGLRLSLGDCTLGDETGSVTFSAWLSPQEAAASVPALTGGDERWYGVSLTTPLAHQAGSAWWSWYYTQEQLDALQEAADRVSQTLGRVKSLADESDKAALVTYLETAQADGARTQGGYVLRFVQAQEGETRRLCRDLGLPEDVFYGPSALEFTLNEKGVLQSVTATSDGLDLALDLGEDPAQAPTPRLEAAWTGRSGGTCGLTLALTPDWAEALTAPEYQNAFDLLPRL